MLSTCGVGVTQQLVTVFEIVRLLKCMKVIHETMQDSSLTETHFCSLQHPMLVFRLSLQAEFVVQRKDPRV